MIAPVVTTDRLILTGHHPDHLDPLAAMWADPAVYTMIGGVPRSREEVWLRLLRSIGQWQAFGYGSWVFCAPDGTVLGEGGLMEARRTIDPPLTLPEANWVLAPHAHGRGFAQAAMAAALGWAYLDSGALYRVVGHAAEAAGIDLDDGVALAALARRLDIRFDGERILVDGREVSDAVRSAAAGVAASRVAVHAPLRAALLQRQRVFREAPGLVADGRDMGSVVFSDACLKVYLTASVAARALRRYKQLQDKHLNQKDGGVSLAALEQELVERDARDAARATAPLKICPGAVVIDSSELGIDAVVARVMQAVRDAGLS